MELTIIILITMIIGLILFTVIDSIPCGKLRDRKTGDIKQISCLDRLAIWVDRKNIL